MLDALSIFQPPSDPLAIDRADLFPLDGIVSVRNSGMSSLGIPEISAMSQSMTACQVYWMSGGMCL